ncbi:hypothetical protein AXF42_Ash016777 [Apostasia shenzhenica]|uniref:Uncharacterized protein n=1 Tax=Apostasia shenzhenica TaxID=1088818 RepID=A0A2I0AQ95_9ASPA|nr:hypothetical protein AXF42_Ash016777 [Apostasia shenzhenica]
MECLAYIFWLKPEENFLNTTFGFCVSDGSLVQGTTSHAKLIARKAKGLPRISISLSGLVDLSAKDAAVNFSWQLFKAYKNKHIDVMKGIFAKLSACSFCFTGQQQLTRLKEVLSSERTLVVVLDMPWNAVTHVRHGKNDVALGFTHRDTSKTSQDMSWTQFSPKLIAPCTGNGVVGGADCDRRCSVPSCPRLSDLSWDIGNERPSRRHVYGQDAAQEPRVNISPPHCQGANIDMGPGMQIVARVDALPKACKDKMGATPADSYPCTL